MAYRNAHACAVLFVVAVVASSVLHARSFSLPPSSGGPGGAQFVLLPEPGAEIAAVRVRSGAYVDAVQLVYRVGARTVATPWHGGGGGTFSEFVLRPGEHITEIGGRSGRFVDSLWLRTNRGRTRKWGGPGGERAYQVRAPTGARIAGFWGRSGLYVDAIGAVIEPSGTHGPIASRDLGQFHEPRAQPTEGRDDGKADSVTSHDFPTPPAGTVDAQRWLKEQADRLLPILQSLASSEDDFRQYRRGETTRCRGDVYCELPYRRQAIAFVLGVDR